MQIRPLEEAYKFGAFFSSYLNESDFYAKPSVLLLGQYSTGDRSIALLGQFTAWTSDPENMWGVPLLCCGRRAEEVAGQQ